MATNHTAHHIVVPNPDNPHDIPIFEGHVEHSIHHLEPGVYKVTVDPSEGSCDLPATEATLVIGEGRAPVLTRPTEYLDSLPAHLTELAERNPADYHRTMDAIYTDLDSRARDLSALLPGTMATDEGAGVTVWFRDPEDDGYGDHVYIVSPVDCEDSPGRSCRWQYQADGGDAWTSEFTIDSDIEQVAEWVRTLAAKNGASLFEDAA